MGTCERPHAQNGPDIDTILIIGAGPIVIGQACEFDYSGTQACKALKAEGYRIVLVNSNPATIMTDPELADATYIEPITPDILAKIIAREKAERPADKLVVLPTMGGQTALNTALSLERTGVLAQHDVEMIGADAAAIDKAEDRDLFRTAMRRIGARHARLLLREHERVEAGVRRRRGGPFRRRRQRGGLGRGPSSIAARKHRLEAQLQALEATPDHRPAGDRAPLLHDGRTGRRHRLHAGRALRDRPLRRRGPLPPTRCWWSRSVLGWKEYEMEVVRDRADNCIIVCSIENVDPMGVHTGDSITVAPALTLTDKEYQIMRNASIAVLREIGGRDGRAPTCSSRSTRPTANSSSSR